MTIEVRGFEPLLDGTSLESAASREPALVHVLDPSPGPRSLQRLADELTEARRSLEDCRREGRRLILISHDVVFGRAGASSAAKLDEESAVVLDSVDCDSPAIALMAEQLALAYRAEHDIKAVVLRFFGALGDGMPPDSPLALWLQAIARGAAPDSGAAAPAGCFTATEDLSRAVVAALDHEAVDGHIVHIADDRPIPWAKWAEAARRAAPPSSTTGVAPWPIGRVTKVAKAHELLDFECTADRTDVVERYVSEQLGRS